MPPNQNDTKPSPVYPEPTAFINPNNTSSHPVVLSQNETMQRTPPKRSRWLLLGVVASLFLTGGVVTAILVQHSTKQTTSKNSGANSGATSSETYYVPPISYDGPFIYKYSGTLTAITGQKGSKSPNLVSEFSDSGKPGFSTRQPLEKSDNYCKSPGGPYMCGATYKTTKGRTVDPLKEGGAYIEVDAHLLSVTNVNLSDATEKASFNIFVDALSPITKSKLAQYEQDQHKKTAWQVLFTLPYPIYVPTATPNGLPIKYQDVSRYDDLYGKNEPYLATDYTNKASTLDIDNAASTYTFTIDQVQKPANFSPSTNCLVGTKKYTCAEMTEVATSPTQKAMVDTSKYHLYKDAAAGGYISTTLFADFGKTIMVIHMSGPTNVFKEDLGAAVVASLNTMAPANLADMRFVSVNMTDALAP